MSRGKLTLVVCSCVFFVVFVGLMLAILHNIDAGNLSGARYLAIAALWAIPLAVVATFEQVRAAVLDVEENQVWQYVIAVAWTAAVYVVGFVIFRP